MKNNFLLWNNIEKKIIESQRQLCEVHEQLNKTENRIVIKSLFIYGVSIFENVLIDVLKEFYKAFPEKMPESKLELTKEQILNESETLSEKLLDHSINKLAYGSLEKFISEFTKKVNISNIDDESIAQLIEIKETRNLMIHNNLIVNTIYLSRCKSSCVRAKLDMINKELPFDKDYTYKSIQLCLYILDKKIKLPLKDKYSSFTKIKAMREIWNYLFDSPILNFDDYWKYNDKGELKFFILDKDALEAKLECGYSHTEKILFAYIMSHYWGSLQSIDGINVDVFNHKFLFGERKEKFLYLQNILFRYPQLFEQDI